MQEEVKGFVRVTRTDGKEFDELLINRINEIKGKGYKIIDIKYSVASSSFGSVSGHSALILFAERE